jgi:hypothetical protein
MHRTGLSVGQGFVAPRATQGVQPFLVRALDHRYSFLTVNDTIIASTSPSGNLPSPLPESFEICRLATPRHVHVLF